MTEDTCDDQVVDALILLQTQRARCVIRDAMPMPPIVSPTTVLHG
jgi:hypothetical protein